MGAHYTAVVILHYVLVKRITALNYKLVNKGFVPVLRGMVLLKAVANAEKLRKPAVKKNMPLAYNL